MNVYRRRVSVPSQKFDFHMSGSPSMSFEAWCMMHESFAVRDRYVEALSSDRGEAVDEVWEETCNA